MSTHRITSTPLHGRSQSADIRAVSGETAGNLKEPKKNPTLHVLKTTSFAASFSDRPALITPQVAPVAKPTDKSVSQDIPGIIQLAKSGTWRAALRLADQLSIKMKPTAPPHILLQLSQLKIVICFKLRLFKSANEELTRLGDFNDMTYQFESYPSIYPSLQGSFVPFSLRILQAELPSYQGNSSLTIDSLYSLLTLCQEQIANSPEFQEKCPTETSSTSWDIEDIDNLFGGPVPLPNFLNPLKTQWKEEPDLFQSDVLCWRWRYSWVQLQIISHFIQQKEYSLALPLIETLTKQFPNNVSLLSAAGRFYIQIGILASAEKAFTTVESLSPPSGCEGEQFNELLEMNRGCLAVGRGDYKEASVHFSAVLNSSPNNLTAANNQAVCLVYTCKLTQAIHLLEDIIARDPSENLSEVLVQNLSCLYDLQSNSGAEKKAHLMKLVAQYGSDSFDHSLLKRHP